jgi:uncharacterized membrane protein
MFSRARYWLIPLLYAVGAILASIVIPRMEHQFFQRAAQLSINSAVAIYSSIASGMMALTAIVFSLAFVMVQFSATAYSPRLVLWVARDPVLSHALGVFSATFLYAISALAWIDRSGSGKVPFVTAWIVIALLLASVGMFIALIHRIGLLQVNRMLLFTADQGRRVIAQLYDSLATRALPDTSNGKPRALVLPIIARSAAAECVPRPPAQQTIRHRGRPRSLQAVRVRKLFAIAEACGGRIDVAAAVGDTLLEGVPLIYVSGARCVVLEQALRDALELGDERTFEQDPKYAIRLLVDIGIKALSAAINDPTTAVQVLDQIGDLLLRLGSRRLEVDSFCDDSGHLRVVMAFPSWDDFLHLAFEEILACGAKSVQVMRRMKALVADLIAVLPRERHAALEYWQRRFEASITRSFEDAEEKLSASVEDRQGLGVTRSTVATVSRTRTAS